MLQACGGDIFTRQMQSLAETQGEKKLVFVTFGGDIVQHGDGQFRQQVETGGTPRYLYWDSRAEWDIANLRIDRRLRQPARHT